MLQYSGVNIAILKTVMMSQNHLVTETPKFRIKLDVYSRFQEQWLREQNKTTTATITTTKMKDSRAGGKQTWKRIIIWMILWIDTKKMICNQFIYKELALIQLVQAAYWDRRRWGHRQQSMLSRWLPLTGNWASWESQLFSMKL